MQRHAREQGMPLEVVRPGSPDDAVTDPDEIRPAIEAWRNQLSDALGENITAPLVWDESVGAPCFTDRPGWDCYAALLLWAAYCEHPELPRPRDCVEDWTTDAAFKLSADPAFSTAFPQLVRDVEIWLPEDVPFVFRAPDPTGHELNFGSSIALSEQLDELNRRTWNASELALAQWRREGAEYGTPLEIGARFAFSIMTDLAKKATAHCLIMKLDY